MFSNCKNDEFPLLDELILQKFELLLECQLHFIQILKRNFLFKHFFALLINVFSFL